MFKKSNNRFTRNYLFLINWWSFKGTHFKENAIKSKSNICQVYCKDIIQRVKGLNKEQYLSTKFQDIFNPYIISMIIKNLNL